MHGVEETSGALVISGGDPAKILETAEAALDDISSLVGSLVEAVDDDAVGFGNNGLCAPLDDVGTELLTIISLVADQRPHRRRERQDIGRSGNVGLLARAQMKDDWPAERIAQRMDLGRPPTARAADRLIVLPPLSVRGTTMSLDRGGIERQRDRCFAELGQSLEDRLPSSSLGPAIEAIVDRRVRPVLIRTIAPTRARLQNMDDAADDTPVVGALRTRQPSWQMSLDTRPLPVVQPKQTRTHSHAPCLLEGGSCSLN